MHLLGCSIQQTRLPKAVTDLRNLLFPYLDPISQQALCCTCKFFSDLTVCTPDYERDFYRFLSIPRQQLEKDIGYSIPSFIYKQFYRLISGCKDTKPFLLYVCKPNGTAELVGMVTSPGDRRAYKRKIKRQYRQATFLRRYHYRDLIHYLRQLVPTEPKPVLRTDRQPMILLDETSQSMPPVGSDL
jgi:hypothetical protein